MRGKMLPTVSQPSRVRSWASVGAAAASTSRSSMFKSALLVLLLIGGTSLLLYRRIESAQASRRSGLQTNGSVPSKLQQQEAEQLAARAAALERAAQQQQETLLGAQQLAQEVSALAQELHPTKAAGSGGGGAGDEALTGRERLWQEKEAAAGGDGEVGGSAGGEGEAVRGEAAAGEGKALPQAEQQQGQQAGAQQQQEQQGQDAQQEEQDERRERLQALLRGRAQRRASPSPVLHYPPFPPLPDPPVAMLSDAELTRRREAVKEAALHAWRSYVAHAWGHDELQPLNKSGKNSFGGLGATIVDSLDTLLMMGLKEDYERAAAWVKHEMPLNASFDASVFETIIRVVGGMLAAHELSGDKELLQRAQAVADRLLPAYDTPTGIPYNLINLGTQKAKNPTWNLRSSTLAEFGTHQLEFLQLSRLTGNQTYARLAEATIRLLHRGWPQQGLFPLFISPLTGKFTARKVSLGALGDSFYEYLLKMWLLGGKQDDMYRQMWERAMDEMIGRLVFTSREGLTYIAEFDRLNVKHKMDHLVCFVPGMLALGVHSKAVPPGPKASRYLEVAANVTRTCWMMYRSFPTGLSPEYVTFTQQGGLRCGAPYNLLRPEALEAFWYMWRVTKDWRYRAWGWEVFQAFQKHCRAEAGYAGLKDVRVAPDSVVKDDTQQSFFLAETLKYLWLLFSPDEALDLDAVVLNTEAHPLRVAPQVGSTATARKLTRWLGEA